MPYPLSRKDNQHFHFQSRDLGSFHGSGFLLIEPSWANFAFLFLSAYTLPVLTAPALDPCRKYRRITLAAGQVAHPSQRHPLTLASLRCEGSITWLFPLPVFNISHPCLQAAFSSVVSEESSLYFNRSSATSAQWEKGLYLYDSLVLPWSWRHTLSNQHNQLVPLESAEHHGGVAYPPGSALLYYQNSLISPWC